MNCETQLDISNSSKTLDEIKKEQSAEKCAKWLESYENSSEVSSECSCTTTTDTSDFPEKDNTLEEFIPRNDWTNLPGDLLGRYSSGRYKNIQISQSRGIHLAPVTYINGPVHINQNILNFEPNKSDHLEELKYSDTMRIAPRRSWLAEPPRESPVKLKEPAELVVICHTASEEGTTPADNIYLIRLVQLLHVESRGWNDIGYNFLIGSDGIVYEGRGWQIEGSHTFGYNKNSVGIAFVGSFHNKLPPRRSLEEAQKLINLGVSIGAIRPDYSLVAHCQISPTTSPGQVLFEELKTWEHWNASIQYSQ